MAEFDAEHDNLRAALDWSKARAGKEEQGLRLAAACGDFWKLRGYLTEGRERLTAALELAEAEMRTGARAWALIWAANLAYLQSDYSTAASLTTEALGIYRELGPAGRAGVALALDWLGEVATEVGDYEKALRLFEEALLIYRGLQDQRGTADMIMQLGWAAMRMGEFERAETFLNESLPLVQALGGSFMLGLNYSGLGELAVRRAQYDRGNDLLEKSLTIRRELGDQWGIATSLGSLGWVALLRGDFDLMRENMRESLAIRTELGDQGGIAWCLEKLAEATVLRAQDLPLSRQQQSLERTVRVCGAAAKLRAPLNSVIDPADQAPFDRMLSDMRRSLGSEAFELAWGEGQAMPLPDIIDIALQPVGTPADLAPLPGARATAIKQGGLTTRERETAYLIAQGKSNREIAAAMTVGVKTVETYVTRIMNKLGFDSRVQIAVWVIENGLVVKKGIATSPLSHPRYIIRGRAFMARFFLLDCRGRERRCRVFPDVASPRLHYRIL
jgi:DNA-binding CsgD family transcriptional regulator/tetratricopeptide (TPR) repeat protein